MAEVKTEKTINLKFPDDMAGWSMRVYFSRNHILAAALFARQSYKIEQSYEESLANKVDNPPRAPIEIIDEDRAYAVGSIFASISFLEALINELLSDTLDKKSWDRLADMDEGMIEDIARIWNIIKDKKNISVLNKYQLVLASVNKEMFNPSKLPYQAIHLLLSLRNELVHYKPEWFDGKNDYQDQSHKWQKRLGSFGFQISKLVTNKAPYFPDQLFGHGLSQWAVNSSIIFADNFYRRIGATPKYNDVRERVNTE